MKSNFGANQHGSQNKKTIGVSSLQNSSLLRITNGEPPTPSLSRDDVDGFEEINEFMLEEESMERNSERSTSQTPFIDNDGSDYVEEVTESFNESDEDVFDEIVTRGRSRQKANNFKAKKEKKEKPKKNQMARPTRTTRAASVRF